MRAWFVAIILLPALGGCFGTDAACIMPRVTAGSQYVFQASGLFDTLSEGPRFIDGSFLGGEIDSRSYVDLPTGSSVTLRIADVTTPHIRFDGSEVPAFQATWAATVPNGSTLAFADEWISAVDGTLIDLTDRRTITKPDGRSGHFSTYTTVHQWSLLASSYLAGRPLVEGSSWTETLPSAVMPEGTFDDGNVALRVEETEIAHRSCTALLSMTFTRPWYPDWVRSFEVNVAGSSSLPLAISETTPEARSPFQLQLVDATIGAGPPLPAMQVLPRLTPDAHPGMLAQAATASGAPLDDGTTFPTRFTDAVAAMRASDTAGPWLRAHPDAVPSHVRHLMGVPDSDVVDAWLVRWSSDSEGRTIYAERTRPTLPVPVLGEGWRIFDGGPADVAAPAGHERLVTIAEMARLHRDIYGKGPETLDCDLVTGICYVGTHASTDRPMAGGTGGALFIWQALTIDIVHGLVFVDASLDSAAVPPPIT